MKSNEYGSVVSFPPLVITYAVIFMVLWCRTPHLECISVWVAKNAFSGIFKEKKKKTCCPRETRWLFKDINLTTADQEKKILSKILFRFLCLFIAMFGAAVLMFWQLLLFEISHSCDEDDHTKDCFEYKLWNSKPQDPINCSSAAVQNGTIQVVCYKIVFNFGVASGASYGAFKLSMFAVNVGTSAMLKIKKAMIIQAIRATFGLLFCGVAASVIVLAVLPSGVSFMSTNEVIICQIITVTGIFFFFLIYIPWKELIALNAARDNQEDTGLENLAADVNAN